MLFTYQGAEPQELPERIKFPDGRTHYLTDGSLTADELKLAGWEGPIELPPFKLGSEKLEWNSDILEYQVVALPDAERERLWASKRAANSKKVAELREAAQARKSQLTELGVNTTAVDSFLALLGSAEYESRNPFDLRLPSETLLGTVPTNDRFPDPFEEWLKSNYASDLQHGYNVVLNELQVTDADLFNAHKQAVTNRFLSDYLTESFTAIAFASSFVDNYDGTAQVEITVLGDCEEVSVTVDGEKQVANEGKVIVMGRGRHQLEVTPLADNRPCGKSETVEVTLI